MKAYLFSFQVLWSRVTYIPEGETHDGCWIPHESRLKLQFIDCPLETISRRESIS